MKILILGDVVGNSGRKAIKNNLSKIIIDYEIGFTIINGENAADDGVGIRRHPNINGSHVVPRDGYSATLTNLSGELR